MSFRFEGSLEKRNTEENHSLGGGRKVEAPQKALDVLSDNRAYNSGYSKAVIERSEKLKELFEYIEKEIDLKMIQNIIGEYLSRSGVPNSVWNTLQLEDFFILRNQSEDIYGWFDNASNLIGLNAASFEDKEIVFLEVLHVIVHEIVHSMAHNRVFLGKKTRRGKYVRYDVVSGYDTRRKDKTLFESFNEGVTERISYEVMVEYINRVGKTKFRDDLALKIEQQISSTSRYGIYMLFVDSICEKISEYANVTKTDVWLAFIRGYFAGDSLYEQQTKELLNNSFGDGFVERLTSLSNKTEIGKLGSFAGAFDFEDPKQSAEKWLQYLNLK